MEKRHKKLVPAGDTDSPTIAVIEALADVEGIPASDLNYALYDFIDPDVLEKLVNGSSTNWSLQFSVDTHTVTIDSGGSITIDGNEYVFNRE